jgi:hypothetical protein
MTTKVQHTPGPWAWERDEDESGHVLWLGADIDRGSHETHLRWICQHDIYPDGGAEEAAQFAECEANARLMAAAPDLLAACRAVLEQFALGMLVRNTDSDGCSDWAIKSLGPLGALALMKGAIAKAEG